MNYLLKSKPKYPNKWKTISLTVLFLILVSLAFLFPSFLRNTSYAISRPLWTVSFKVSESYISIKGFFVSKSILISRNIALEDELSSLRLKEIDYDILSKENDDLKSQLGRKENSSRILSRILSKPPRSPYDTLVIDVGSREGISLGSKVYLGGNIIIGLVTNVTPNTSLVELFSSGNKKQESILSRTGAGFTLLGQGGTNFKLEVPKDTDILWGDIFMYPGLSSSVLGTVYYVDTSSQSSFKTIYLRVPGNVFSSQWVFVEKNF